MISVVIETITARFDASSGSLADSLEGTLAALGRQTVPHECIVVLDGAVSPEAADELRRRHPDVMLAWSAESNYFAAKNEGAARASGSIVALLDGDCEPAPDWIELLLAAFDDEVSVVAGRTRYTGRSLAARTFSVPDFANVLEDGSGDATGFNLNNVAFRREVLMAHPLEAQIRRNGGCYLLYHQLRAAGARIVYEPRAVVNHGTGDVEGLNFVRKHFDRGYDGVSVYRLDSGAVLRGTRFFRRFGALALLAITSRRVLLDWIRLMRHRRQIGISLPTLPYFGAVIAGMRLIELAGGITAVIPGRSRRPSPR